MNRLTKSILITILALLVAVSAAGAAPIGPRSMGLPAGEIVQTFALLNGDAAYIEIHPTGGGYALTFNVLTEQGQQSLGSDVALPAPPDQLKVSACGYWVHAWVHAPGTGLMYYRWQLAEPIANCRDYQTYLPSLAH